MLDVIECPQCHRQLRVPEGMIGRLVKCPACAVTFTVSDAPEARPASPEVAGLDPRPSEPIPFQDEPDEPRRGVDREPRDLERPRPGVPLAPHRGGMILTFGVVSLVCGCLGIVCGPMAWVMGNADLEEIRAGRMDPEGEGLTNAGRICGIVGTILSALSCCCIGIQELGGR
jgi:predicted Zn finger-like uncharacterized protein